jgi:hypothetical protein
VAVVTCPLAVDGQWKCALQQVTFNRNEKALSFPRLNLYRRHLLHIYTACVYLRQLFQPKVKDRVGNENNWIHVENTTAGVAPDGASAAAADGGLGPLLASETLRSMNLLEVPESPRESYTSEQPTQVRSGAVLT